MIILLHKNRTDTVHMTARMFVCGTCDFCHSRQVRTYLRAAPKTFARIAFAVPENAGACTFQTEEVLLAAREKCSSNIYDRKSAQVFFLLCKSSVGNPCLANKQAFLPPRLAWPPVTRCVQEEKRGVAVSLFPFSVVSTRDLPHKSAGENCLRPPPPPPPPLPSGGGEGENKNKSIHRQVPS